MRLADSRKKIAQITSHPICEDTPADVFARLDDHSNVFWLDSGDAVSGWSYLGVAPSSRILIPTPAVKDSHSLYETFRQFKTSGVLRADRISKNAGAEDP